MWKPPELTRASRSRNRSLRRTAKIEVRIDRALGQALIPFREKNLHESLGFVRLSDYVREVLGISMRTVQEMIHTERCLQKLPETALYWEMGLLNSEQVRLLCRVGSPVWERDWAYAAQGMSVRQLADAIQKWKTACERERDEYEAAELGATVSSAGATSGGTANEGAGSCEGVGEGSQLERISFPALLPTAVRWRMTLRMCREISGQELADWALAENICADYLAGRPLPEEETPRVEESEPGTANSDGSGVKGSEGAGCAGANGNDGSGSAATDKTSPPDEPVDAERMKHVMPWLPQALDSFLDEKPPEDAWALSKRIERLGALRTRIETLLSKRLYEFVYHDEPWRAGYKTMAGYAQEVLGLSGRRARYLMSLERRLFGAPAVREAYRRGELSWLSCLLLLRVTRGDDSEKAWVEYAKQVSVLRLREAVEDGQLRAAVEYPCLPPPIRSDEADAQRWRALASERQMSARPRASLAADSLLGTREGGSCEAASCETRSWEVGSDENGSDNPSRWNDGRQVPAPPGSARHSDGPEFYKAGTGIGTPCAHERQTSARVPRVPKVRIAFSAPKDVAELWRHTVAEVRRLEGHHLEDWEVLERILDSFIATWDDENARRIRRDHKIVERDGWRCTVPVCSSRRDLHVHHVRFRSRGGCDEGWNLTTLCIPHHQHAIHGPEAGRVKLTGRAPSHLRWELGCQENGRPSFVFEGERRVRLLEPGARVTVSRLRTNVMA